MAIVRLARTGDLAALAGIERAAGTLFAAIGMQEVADGETLPFEVLRDAAVQGRLWVAVDATDEPVGFAVLDALDGCAYLKEISVHPDTGGRGVGTELLAAVIDAARASGARALTLSTFRDVAWNAPWYARHGFRILAEAEVSRGLLGVRAREAAAGLDVARRVFMRRELR